MDDSYPHFIFAFHGCDKTIGEELVLRKRIFRFSSNAYDWLGSGIYFWENDPKRALDWAIACKEKPNLTKGHIQDPYVIGALIDLTNCFDLTISSNISLLKSQYCLLKDVYEKAGMNLPQNEGKKHFLDNLVLNGIFDSNSDNKYPKFNAVRCAFKEGKPAYPGSDFSENGHIQICVHDMSCIKALFVHQI